MHQSILDDKQRLYGSAIPIVGVTGGIGTGKSTISQMLTKDGQVVIDADLLVKKIYLEAETLAFIHSLVPEVISEKKIDFKKLRELVFQRSSLKEDIEEFIYKRLPAAFQNELKLFKDPKIIFYDIPLLFEKNIQNKFDLTVLVYAPKEIQITRAAIRDNLPENLISKIIDSQMPIEEKRALADYVIDNSSDLDHLKEKYQKFLLFLKLHLSL